MWISPRKTVYVVLADPFEPGYDFDVYSVHKGVVVKVPLDQLDMTIYRGKLLEESAISDGWITELDPEDWDEESDLVEDKIYYFPSKGIYTLRVTYLHKWAYFYLQVIDPDNMGLDDLPTGGGGGIIIEWARPDRGQPDDTPPGGDDDGGDDDGGDDDPDGP